MGFAATLEILTSREVSVLGAIGACTSLKKKAPYVADTEIGQGGTYVWCSSVVFERSVRARSARISAFSLSHVSITVT